MMREVVSRPIPVEVARMDGSADVSFVVDTRDVELKADIDDIEFRTLVLFTVLFFFSSRRRHTISLCDWSSDVCSSDLSGNVCGSVVATTDPQTLPDLTTWYLVTNLPAPPSCPVTAHQLAEACLEEVIRLYGDRKSVV